MSIRRGRPAPVVFSVFFAAVSATPPILPRPTDTPIHVGLRRLRGTSEPPAARVAERRRTGAAGPRGSGGAGQLGQRARTTCADSAVGGRTPPAPAEGRRRRGGFAATA